MTVDDQIRAELGTQLAKLFNASGIDDAEPGSTLINFESRTVSVLSRSRGRVDIGRLNDLRFLAITSTAAERLEAVLKDRTAAATAKRAERGGVHRTRAAELRSEGLSVPQIGIRMAHEEGRPDQPYSPRTVSKWLSAAGDKKG